MGFYLNKGNRNRAAVYFIKKCIATSDHRIIMMKLSLLVVLCIFALASAQHHRRRRPTSDDSADSQVQEAKWFQVKESSSFWSRTVFRLKNSNVRACEEKCISFKGACMSFDYHRRTGTCYGRPEGSVIFDSEDQAERVHHSNHYDFYYISTDDLITATQDWQQQSPDAADAVRAERKEAEYELQRRRQEEERERAKVRHQQMLEERRRLEASKPQRPHVSEPEPEVVVVPEWNNNVRKSGSYVHDPDFTCVSGVKSYANGRLMSDTTEYERCEVRSPSTPHQCYQLSLEMTMNAGVGRQVKTASYTGGCFYPEERSVMDQGREAAMRNLPNDISLDDYAFATCVQKNCFDLSQTDFTCVSGVKSYANGRLMSDTSEFETCQDRGYGSAPRECYQVSMETTMNANGFQVQTQSYTGGCFYPEMRRVLDQGAEEASRQLPDEMEL